jgi:hypothetical protein
MTEKGFSENVVFRYPEGSSEQRKKEIRDEVHEDTGDEFKEYPNLSQIEIAKDGWRKEIIVKTNAVVNEYVKEELGLELEELPESRIHMLKPDDFPEVLDVSRYSRGVQRKGHVFISSEIMREEEPKLEFAKILIHEVLHTKIFQKFSEIPVTNGLHTIKVVAPEREGMSSVKRNRYPIERNFEGISEGLTQLLTKKIFHRLVNSDPYFREELTAKFRNIERKITRQELFSQLGADAYDTEDVEVKRLGDRTEYAWTQRGAYHAEQDLVKFICEKISGEKPKKYASPNSVLALFSKAEMKGDLLTIGREIDQVFGKGSYRLIASVPAWHEEGNNTYAINAIRFLNLPQEKRDPKIAQHYIFGRKQDEFEKYLRRSRS